MRWPHQCDFPTEHHGKLQTEKQSFLRAAFAMYLQKYKQRTSTVNLMARRQLHCQTSLIVSSVASGVFKHLRFKQVHTTVIVSCVGYIVWQSTAAAPQGQL